MDKDIFMIGILIYAIGFIITFGNVLVLQWKVEEEITLKSIALAFLAGFFSWIIVILAFIVTYWERPIVKKKRRD